MDTQTLKVKRTGHEELLFMSVTQMYPREREIKKKYFPVDPQENFEIFNANSYV